jgi:outer membrane protein OmpA-like peptidoglycan-associated protein
MKKIAVLSFIILGLSGIILAQNTDYHTNSRKAKKYFKDAQEYLQNRQVDLAISAVKEAKIEDPDFLEAWVLLSEIYQYQAYYDKMEKAVKEVIRIDPEYDPGFFLKAAELAYRKGNYHQAEEYLEGFEEYSRSDLESNVMYKDVKERVVFSVHAVENPVDYNPYNLGAKVNTKFDDYWPSLTADEQTLVTTVLIPANNRNYHSDSYQEDLFVTHKNEAGEWMAIKNMGKTINSMNNEGAQCISVDGNMCIFTACNRRDGYGSCDLYASYKEGNMWGSPQNLGPKVNSANWESNPSLSADGKWLYYSSSDKSGHGKNDIWRVRINPGLKFGEPENLGPVVNSDGADGSPFIHPDGKTLFFASDGHVGLGSFDLFVTKLQDDGTWSVPENLGYPINTHGEERSLIVNAGGDLAMIASEREDSYGGLDIYEFDLQKSLQPEPVTYVKGKVYDVETNDPLQAECRLMDPASGELIAIQKSNKVDGRYLVVLPVGKEYAFNVDKAGYLFFSENFSLKDWKESDGAYIMDIPLQPIKEGKSAVLNNIFFDYDKYDLKDESFAELQKLVEFMKKNPNVSIEIGGHTDDRGSAEYNKSLSENRAKAVYNYLVDKGISSERLTFKGYGFDNPVEDNATEAGRAKNRRTEFKIIKVNATD